MEIPVATRACCGTLEAHKQALHASAITNAGRSLGSCDFCMQCIATAKLYSACAAFAFAPAAFAPDSVFSLPVTANATALAFLKFLQYAGSGLSFFGGSGAYTAPPVPSFPSAAAAASPSAEDLGFRGDEEPPHAGW